MKKGDDDHLYYEDGTKERLSCKKFRFPFGKFKDVYISDIYDTQYLKFVLDVVVEDKKDWYLKKMVKMRLAELKRMK